MRAMSADTKPPKQMVGGCCVCSDERGWPENPLVYCDGDSCSVAVHQACYGILQVPTGSWFCRRCESQERAARVKCDLCPSKEGALKRTETGTWAHVVCALYIPEVRFGNNLTMEPIVLRHIPPERFSKLCYICEYQGRRGEGASGAGGRPGACMNCNRPGCRLAFHVTCAQSLGLLCEEEGNSRDNVKYCGYCSTHYQRKLKRGDVEGDGSCDSNDAAASIGRTRKADSRNGPLSSSSSTTSVGTTNGVAEPSVIEAANCLADMKRYDAAAACRSTIDGARPQPTSLAAPSQTQSVAAPNGLDTAFVGQVASGQGLADQISTKADRSVSQVSAAAAIECSSMQPSFESSSAAANDSGSAKSVPAKRPTSQQQRRRNNVASGRSRDVPSPSSASSSGPTKSAKRQKLQRQSVSEPSQPIAADQVGNSTTTTVTPATVSNGPAAAASDNAVSPLRHVASYAGVSLGGMAGGGAAGSEERQQQQQRVPTASSPVPQSMQQLLEKQFEQGSQFLMEQAQYFDIASLLGCLAQLQTENKQLEDTVRGLSARRDHLASVNARLSLSLGAIASMHSGGSGGVTAGSAPCPAATPTVVGTRPALSPRLSPRGPGDIGQLQATLPGVPSPNVAMMMAAAQPPSSHGQSVSSARLLEAASQSAMDHHLHQQQQFMLQQQQQLQHMMLMAQSHAPGAGMPPPVSSIGGAVNILPNLVAPGTIAVNASGLVVPMHHGAAVLAPAQQHAEPPAPGQSYIGSTVAPGAPHTLHLLPTVNAMAAAAVSMAGGSGTGAPVTVAQHQLASVAGGLAGTSGNSSAFSPALAKLQKSDRKAS